jgi:hypothetical protein
MEPDQAAGIFPIGPGFASETGSIGGIADRQYFFVQQFISVKIRERHFSCRDEKIVFVLQTE